jgi:hypothetical protein
LVFQIRFVKLVNIDDVVVPVLADGAAEAYARGAIFAKAFYVFAPVVVAPENVKLLRGIRNSSSRYVCLVILNVHF